MSGPENTFIKGIHAHLPHTLYRIKNNNMYHAGIADCWYSGVCGDLWIEYKFVIVPKRDDTCVNLTEGKTPEISFLQQEWLESRHTEGRIVGVIVGCKAGGVWYSGTTWKEPQNAAWFQKNLVSRKQLAELIVELTS